MSMLPNHSLDNPQPRPEPAGLYKVQYSKQIMFPRKSDLFQLRVKMRDNMKCYWFSVGFLR
jgi:hypothetical protein